MASNILSRLLPSASDEYDADRPGGLSPPNSPGNHGVDIDEENLGERFQEQDLEHLLADAGGDSRITTGSAAFPREGNVNPPKLGSPLSPRRDFTRPSLARENTDNDDDNDVPESLLLEGGVDTTSDRNRTVPRGSNDRDRLPSPVPGPFTRQTRAQWEATRTQQRLHDSKIPPKQRPGRTLPRNIRRPLQDPKEKAMWLWANVQDLDKFFSDVYAYYIGHGIWSITLSRVLRLLQTAFITFFTILVTFCIDYKAIPKSQHLRQIVYENAFDRIHGLWKAILVALMVYWCYVLYQFIVDIPRLKSMHDFYHHLLGIPDSDIQTVSWQLVVSRLMALRDSNVTTARNVSSRNRGFIGTQSKQRMDAHDIANRLMRRENYLIAMFNKDILDLSIQIPLIGKRQFFSKTTEWHINLSILDFVFTQRNQVDRVFLSDRHRRQLIDNLKKRLIMTGIVSIFWAPLSVPYFVLSYFFRYFTEFQKEPARLAMRSFTPLAEWKFREFNELQHYFERRRNMSYPYADKYLQMFPKDKFEQICGFLALVTGAPASVLIIATLLDEQLLLGFEIAWGKNVLFFITILSAIFTIASKSISQDDIVMDPKLALTHVIECTHYCPSSWKNQLHSDEVRKEFTALYQNKTVIFLEELLSMTVTPFLLMTKLTECADRIVDFFREFTVHVDGLGTVCSFAVFEFDLGGDNIARKKALQGREDSNLREDYYSTKDGKMMASYQNFLDVYGSGGGRGSRVGPAINKSNFIPPPTFSTFNIAEEVGMHPIGRTNINRPTHRNPRTGPINKSSPMHSLLLDPHHQPSTSALRSPTRLPQGRHRNTRQRLSEANELNELDEEEEAGPSYPLQNLTTTRIIEEDSHLGDSWRTGEAGRLDVEEEEATDPKKNGGGVLGLLYQFQKAQTEGRQPGA